MDMKKVLALSAIVFCAVSLSSCRSAKEQAYYDRYVAHLDEGATPLSFEEWQKTLSREVSLITASEDKITISLNLKAEKNVTSKIYITDPENYYFTDMDTGFSRNLVLPDEDDCEKIGSIYNNIGPQEIVIDRFDQFGNDRIYSKYYAISGDEILAGPFYCNEITPINDSVIDEWDEKEDLIKGLICGDSFNDDNLADENASTYRTDLMIDSMYLGSETDLANRYANSIAEGKVIPFKSNGKTHYFNVEKTDNIFSTAYKNHVRVSLILLTRYKNVPSYALYPGVNEYKKDAGAQGFTVSDFSQWSTITREGRESWSAIVEFLSSRYGGNASVDRRNRKLGGLENLIIGNEVDFAATWNTNYNFLNKKPDINEYCEEIYRQLRISSIAARKYSHDVTCTISFTHYWGKTGENIEEGKEGKELFNVDANYSYAPKDMLDILFEKSNNQGNFNWGLSLHPYDISLTNSDIFSQDIKFKHLVTGNIDSPFLVPANFEIIDKFLEQEKALYKGNIRNVYLPESGFFARAINERTVSQGGVIPNDITKEIRENEEDRQVFNVIYFFSKLKLMKSIKSYQYFNNADDASLINDGHAFGLRSSESTLSGTKEKKKAFQVYCELESMPMKDIFTKYADYIAKYKPTGITFEANDTYVSLMKKIAKSLSINILNFDLIMDI